MSTPRLFLLFCTLLAAPLSFAQKANREIALGNKAYQQQNYKQAAAYYTEALKKEPANEVARFNLGNALQKQKQFEAAAKTFATLAEQTRQAGLRTKTVYNRGVSAVRQQQLEQAIEDFKQTLRLDPGDSQARENLQKALNELKKQQQQQDQQQQNQKNRQDNEDRKKNKSNLQPKKAEQLLNQLQQQEKQLQGQLQKQKAPSARQEKDW